MTAAELTTDTILPLQTTDTGSEALGLMSDFYLRHLPVVDNGRLVRIISEDELLDSDPEAEIGQYKLMQLPPAVRAEDHLYDVMKVLARHQLTIVPVVDADLKYLGMVTAEDVLNYFSDSGSFQDPGAIIVLSMHRHDYSLAEIARIVESEGVLILSNFVRSFPDSNRIEVTIKLNSENVGAIIATLERYDYQVKASFNEREFKDALMDRYDSLMNYLNV
ncbi:MAG: CBS domain-containing protein [Bacteroidota bacterium]